MKNLSSFSFIVCAIILIAGLLYKPRWKQKGIHAAISYDVSGYYIYLPAVFIYKDLDKVAFKQDNFKKYKYSFAPYETFTHTNGNEIAKYSCGLALQYLPFFLIADSLAEPLGYERDGYSLPYQAGIHWGSVLIAFLGLFYLRKNLLEYFSDKTVALTLLLLVIGTNYLNYAIMGAAQTHNYLFTLFTLLIWNTIQWHKKPTYLRAVAIGFLLGLAALTRPTEIMMLLIPVFWGVSFFSKETTTINLSSRLSFLKKYYPQLLLSAFVCLALGSIQMIYWKSIGGDWFINGYQDNMGFDWFQPHIIDGLFSYKKGWLLYTPMMIFSLLGIALMLKKRHGLGQLIFIYVLLFIYITFSWKEWWYAGSLGQRPMVQTYAILAFPFAFCIQWMMENKKRFIPFLAISLFFCYYNIWLHHQAHRGGTLDAQHMTRTYFQKIFLRWDRNDDDKKFLDIDEEFVGTRQNIQQLYFNDFEQDSLIGDCGLQPINGNKSYCIHSNRIPPKTIQIPLLNEAGKWIRVKGTFRQKAKEWNCWEMPQLVVHFKEKDKIVKAKLIRISRILDMNETKDLFMDVEMPKEKVTSVEIYFWLRKPTSPSVLVDDLYVEVFD